MAKLKAAQNHANTQPKNLKVKGKNIWIVDDHQYVLPIWGRWALKNQKSYVLVSIDYHPDTNPPFWLFAYQKAMAKDPLKEETLLLRYQQQLLKKINPKDIKTLELVMEHMRNDEHINTGLFLGYLKDYHMINCMEKHNYAQGHHYLMKKEAFGSLNDQGFYEAGFELKDLKEHPYILDIDLDYFLKKEELTGDFLDRQIFTDLVKHAELITIARSEDYFDYLKEDAFTIETCEKAVLELISKIVEKNYNFR